MHCAHNAGTFLVDYWQKSLICKDNSINIFRSCFQVNYTLYMFIQKTSINSHISIDCIKACPYQANLFAFAYYQTNPTREGAISVTNIKSSEDFSNKIKPIQAPPLLHLQWSRKINDEENYLIFAAERQNNIRVYLYCVKDDTLSHFKTINIGQNIFCLYLDCAIIDKQYKLVVSSNESSVFQILLDQSFQKISQNQYKKHEYSVWTCRINPYNKSMFACGDEINSLYLYESGQLIGKNSQSNGNGTQSGICDIVFVGEHSFYSGGFNGVVSLFDTRNIKTQVMKKQIEGGIWRIIPNEDQSKLLLCNYPSKTFHIYDKDLLKQTWNSGEAHNSLAYAADWGKNSLLTASFYDKKLVYWREEEF